MRKTFNLLNFLSDLRRQHTQQAVCHLRCPSLDTEIYLSVPLVLMPHLTLIQTLGQHIPFYKGMFTKTIEHGICWLAVITSLLMILKSSIMKVGKTTKPLKGDIFLSSRLLIYLQRNGAFRGILPAKICFVCLELYSSKSNGGLKMV